MITAMEAEFKVSEEGGSSVVTGTFEYGMTNIIGNILNNVTIKKMNQKAWVQFLAGIKHHLETSENVNIDTNLDLSPVQEL